jgi:hypothetical protein
MNTHFIASPLVCSGLEIYMYWSNNSCEIISEALISSY